MRLATWSFIDLKSALRRLGRDRAFAAGAIATLALGVAASASLFTVAKGAILDPWPYAGADRILTFQARYPPLGLTDSGEQSVPQARALRAAGDLFDASMVGAGHDVNLEDSDRPERIHAVAVSASTFPMLGVSPLLGRVFGDDEDRPGAPCVVVMSFGLWQGRYAADSGILGRSLSIGGESCTVVGVMPRSFTWWDARLYFPLRVDWSREDVSNRWLHVQARRRAEVPQARVEAALEVLSRDYRAQHEAAMPELRGFAWHSEPLRSEVLREVRQSLAILLGSTAILLAAACANLGLFLMARTTARQADFALRSALGASRLGSVRQILCEGFLIGSAGAALGALLAGPGAHLVAGLIPYGYIPAEANLEPGPWTAVFAGLLALALGSFLGLAPLLALPLRALTASANQGRGTAQIGPRVPLRRLLLVVQVALAFAVLSGAALLVRSSRRLLEQPLGFDPAGAVAARIALPPDRYPQGRDIARFAAQLADLEPAGRLACGLTSRLPLSGRRAGRLDVEGKGDRAPSGELFEADTVAMTPGYLGAIGASLLAGRNLRSSDSPDATPVAVINRSLAEHLWPGDSALGRRLRAHGRGEDSAWRTVVGVVSDIRQGGLEETASPVVYVPLAQNPSPARFLSIVVRGAPGEVALGLLRDRLRAIDPALPLYATLPLEDLVQQALGGRRVVLILLSVFGAATLLLEIVAAYGLLSLTVAERRREIGLRMALGARTLDVFFLFERQALEAVMIGLLAGGILALVGRQALRTIVFGVETHDVAVLLGCAALLLSVTAAAAAWPSWRASRLPPASALRAD